MVFRIIFLIALFCLPVAVSSQQQINTEMDLGSFTDGRDGQDYDWVKIGSQIWMAENLNIGKIIYVRNGKIINSSIEKLCYKNDNENCEIYGGLYSGYVINQFTPHEGDQSICPDGWHLPTDGEWQILVDYMGGTELAGGAMKEASFTHWKKPNKGATNSSGFNALPGGFGVYEEFGASCTDLGKSSYFWSSTIALGWSILYPGKVYQTRSLHKNKIRIIRDKATTVWAISVRCIMD